MPSPTPSAASPRSAMVASQPSSAMCSPRIAPATASPPVFSAASRPRSMRPHSLPDASASLPPPLAPSRAALPSVGHSPATASVRGAGKRAKTAAPSPPSPLGGAGLRRRCRQRQRQPCPRCSSRRRLTQLVRHRPRASRPEMLSWAGLGWAGLPGWLAQLGWLARNFFVIFVFLAGWHSSAGWPGACLFATRSSGFQWLASQELCQAGPGRLRSSFPQICRNTLPRKTFRAQLSG